MSVQKSHWLKILEVGILLLTAVILYWQVSLVREELAQARLRDEESGKQTQMSQSIAWVDRISADEVFWGRLFATREVLADSSLSEDQKLQRLAADAELTTSLQQVLARFETLGLQYNTGGLDKEYIKRSMGDALVYYFDKALFYIQSRRQRGRGSLYKEYESMVAELRK